MPIINILRASLALSVLAVSAVIALWYRILDWAKESFLPWLRDNFAPNVASAMEDAFIWFDANVAVPVRRAIKTAWRKLRPHLLKMAVHFEQQSRGKWMKRMTSWVVKVLGEPKVVVVKTEEEVNWDDLPPEVKEVWMKNNQTSHELDITDVRDKQIDAMTMTE